MFTDEELKQIKYNNLKNEMDARAKLEVAEYLRQKRTEEVRSVAYNNLKDFPKYIKTIGLQPIDSSCIQGLYKRKRLWIVFIWAVAGEFKKIYYIDDKGQYYEGPACFNKRNITEIANDISRIPDIYESSDIEKALHNVFASALRGNPISFTREALF